MRLVLLLALASIATATNGVDVSSYVSTSGWSCLKGQGVSFAVVRVYMSTGSVDPNAVSTIKNAWAGGMSHVDGYIFPCPRCGNPAGQVSAAVSHLRNNGVNFGMIWLDIEGTQYWMSESENRAFFDGMIKEAEALGVKLGVYTSYSQWVPIMGGDFYSGSRYPLWYPHYDDSPSFSDFSPFGGWTKPSIKQFRGSHTACGVGIDSNWYP